MRRGAGRLNWRAAMIASAAATAALMRAMTASTWALTATNSGKTFLAALRLPKGAPGFAGATPGKLGLRLFRGAFFCACPPMRQRETPIEQDNCYAVFWRVPPPLLSPQRIHHLKQCTASIPAPADGARDEPSLRAEATAFVRMRVEMKRPCMLEPKSSARMWGWQRRSSRGGARMMDSIVLSGG